MANVFYYDIDKIKSYYIDPKKDFFEQILELRKDNPNPYKFYIRLANQKLQDYIARGDVRTFAELRDLYSKLLASCNLDSTALEDDLESGGIRISDPSGLVEGQISIINHIMTYSPALEPIYTQEEDTKFAREIYYTGITFNALLINQIKHAKTFRQCVGKNENGYIKEELSKEKMIKLVIK